jgi:hypothetical protein
MENRKLVISTIAISICLLILSPSRAFSLAGIAERHSTFYLNKYANVRWEHPGDICDGNDYYCLSLEKVEHGVFEGLEYSLEEINIPATKSSPYIIARRSMDDTWLVYDLEKERYVIEATGFNEAHDVWKSLGFAMPSFIDSKSPEEYLAETIESILARWRFGFVLWSAFLFVPCLLLSALLMGLTFSLYKKYRENGLRKHLILSRVLMVSTGIAILFSLIFSGALVLM